MHNFKIVRFIMLFVPSVDDIMVRRWCLAGNRYGLSLEWNPSKGCTWCMAYSTAFNLLPVVYIIFP